jgi:hypothetical protein
MMELVIELFVIGKLKDSQCLLSLSTNFHHVRRTLFATHPYS